MGLPVLVAAVSSLFGVRALFTGILSSRTLSLIHIFPESLDKIRAIRKMITEQGLNVDIQVDGGIYLTNVREVLDAGANIIVAGSAVFNGDAAQNTKEFMEILKSYE